jgi:hypothetical protein
MSKFAKWVFYLGLLLMAGYFVFGPRFWLDNDFGHSGSETKTMVLSVVPIGSRIDTAKIAMEAKGFHCQMKYNRRYAGDDDAGNRRQIVYPAADFLWCDTGDRSYQGIIISKRWQVILEAKNGAVAQVAVGVGLTGP